MLQGTPTEEWKLQNSGHSIYGSKVTNWKRKLYFFEYSWGIVLT